MLFFVLSASFSPSQSNRPENNLIMRTTTSNHSRTTIHCLAFVLMLDTSINFRWQRDMAGG